MQALTNRKITVFGGGQIRPNIHIDDIAEVYVYMLNNPDLTGVYNAGFENISILDIAKKIIEYIPAELEIIPNLNDPRSYRLNSEKLMSTGFRPIKTVNDAIVEIIAKYHLGELRDEDCFYNLKWMQKTFLN
jgi:nucleoside-diphosphate-sugar epimerase